jgi:histone deacetylase complex regulatory component SIN3
MSFVEGSMDATRYEDGCRQLMGNKAYLLYTLDKVVANILKQLHNMVSEEAFEKLRVSCRDDGECGGVMPGDSTVVASHASSRLTL